MFITGPAVIKSVTAEEVTAEQLGGAMTHNTTSGVAHFAAENEDDCIEQIRYLLSFLPSNNMDDAPERPTNDDPSRMDEELNTVIPDNANMPYDMKDVIRSLVDDGEFYEVHQHYATNIITCFAHFDGRSVGIIANQPAVMAGCLDINASDKSARFIRFCDAFNIPIVNLVDVPGFLPGTDQEYGGIIRHGAKCFMLIAKQQYQKLHLSLVKHMVVLTLLCALVNSVLTKLWLGLQQKLLLWVLLVQQTSSSEKTLMLQQKQLNM